VKTRPRVFYGWWVVLASAFGLLLGPVPIAVFSFGVFLKPLAQEFHAGRAAVSLAFTLHNTIGAFSVALAGQLVDRSGARKVILTAMVLSALALFSCYLCSTRIWQLYAFFFLLGLFGPAAGPVSFAKVISLWFDRRRGLALGLMFLGMGLGTIIIPWVAQRLIAGFGWRFAYAAIGAAMLLITVPMIGFLVRDEPEQTELLPDDATRVSAPARLESGQSLREAWRTWTFWILLGAFVLVSASTHACFTHMAAIFTDRGSSSATAASAISLFGVGVLVGRGGSGYLLDRVFAPRLSALIFSCAAAGIALLGISNSEGTALLAALAIGFGWGTEGDVKAYLIGRYFGLRCFGQIYGFTFAGFVLGGGLGAYLMGAAFDAKHSYTLPLFVACFALVTSAALLALLGPYRYQAGSVVGPRHEAETIHV
jgi:MFS family permease